MNHNLSKLILTAVALGLGISTFVLNFLGSITMKNAISLLAIGLICLALSKLKEK